MTENQVQYLEKLTYEAGGDYSLNHSKRLLKLVEEFAGDITYNKDLMIFCVYTHDLGAYKPYKKEGVEHALRSKEIVVDFFQEFSFSEEEQNIALEAIASHHSAGQLQYTESVLLRDADALDFIGIIGAARDITRVNQDLVKGIFIVIIFLPEHRQKTMMKQLYHHLCQSKF